MNERDHAKGMKRADPAGIDEPAKHISPDVIERVISTLSNLSRCAALELALKVGEVVLAEIYRGDLVALRERGPSDVSFRKLAAHPRLPFSPVTLWRSVAIYELVQRFPGLTKAKHLGVAHMRAIVGLPERIQEQLLRAAETERWSKERVEDTAARYRNNGRGRRGRLPAPPPLRCLRRIDRLAAREISSTDRLDLGGMSDAGARKVEDSLRRIRAWCAAIEQALEARGAGTGSTAQMTVLPTVPGPTPAPMTAIVGPAPMAH